MTTSYTLRRMMILCISAAIMALCCCNNPFSTRTPETPSEIGGASVKPANSAENVIYNLRVSIENKSLQDYLDIFSESFTMHPDPDDSLAFEQDFRYGWDKESERLYAEHFLQPTITDEIAVLSHLYDYQPGQDMFDYVYSFDVFPADSTGTVEKVRVRGHAYLYLNETDDGSWALTKWVELENMSEVGGYITWAVLRRNHR
jgi:hypothetical protein